MVKQTKKYGMIVENTKVSEEAICKNTLVV